MNLIVSWAARKLAPLVPYLLTAFVALAALLGGSLWVYGAGKGTGIAEVTAVLESERRAHAETVADFTVRSAAASVAAEARVAANLSNQKAEHDRITTALRLELDRSGLRAARLAADLARLHDAAASGGRAPAADPAPPGGAPGTAEAADLAPSVADLIETCTENYGIAHRNATRLVELQDWYSTLRGENRGE